MARAGLSASQVGQGPEWDVIVLERIFIRAMAALLILLRAWCRLACGLVLIWALLLLALLVALWSAAE